MWLSLLVDYTVTFAGSIFIMAEFSTTSTYLVKDMQMFLGIELPEIINRFQFNEHLSLSQSLESDSNTPISFRTSLSVRFIVEVKFLSCLLLTSDLTARTHCATEK